MSTLTDKLRAAGEHYQGTELGSLLQWAALHIAEQGAALDEARAELAEKKANTMILDRKTNMFPHEFDALCTLLRMRKGSPSREAARLVMVWCCSGEQAAASTGVSKAGVYAATARARKGLQLARQAVGLSD